jgi:hypothetical protein
MLAIMAADAAHAESLDPKAEEVIARTRATTATYTIYWRVGGTDGSSKPDYNWAATFHRGSLHRFESKAWRVVADCAAGTGTKFYVSMGGHDYSTGAKIAKQYCGINADRDVLSSVWLGQKEGKFGEVDEIRIVDRDGTSTYQVTADGIVVGITTGEPGTNYVAVVEPIALERDLPSGDVFSRKSLASSFVPKVIQSQGSRPDR